MDEDRTRPLADSGVGGTPADPAHSPADVSAQAGPASDQDLEAERVRATVRLRLGLSDQDASPRIGRFAVLRRLGQGGMGVVYAVYDEELDRRVALKLISGGTRPEHRARLRREGQALAKLSHPNVVPVFEVGEHEAELFIAMEFVKGQTLRAWVSEAARATDEIIGKYEQAAAGLAAAHAAGIVHRDFKPDNALVGAAGRVRVVDFGLARRSGDDPDPADPHAPAKKVTSGGLDAPLTATGAAVGTPGYMAPEQFAGHAADHRTDQFSFCIALWEALCGERPFDGRTSEELLVQVADRKIRAPSPDTKMPRWLRSVLERGLEPDPDARWPSMDALLGAIGRGRRGRRAPRAVLAAGALVVGSAAATWAMHSWTEEPARATPCPDAWPQLDGVWDADRRATVAQVVRGDGAQAGAEAARLTTQHLDAFAGEWVDAHGRACRAHHLEHTESAELFDRKMSCLGRRRDAMAALGDAMLGSGEAAAAKAVEAALAIPPVHQCEDNDRILAQVPLPDDPAQVEAIARVRSALQRQRALRNLGEIQAAREIAAAAVADADALAYRPLQAEAGLELAECLHLLAEWDAEAETLRDAGWYAEAGGDDQLTAKILVGLAWVEVERRQPQRVRELARRTRAVLERLGRPSSAEPSLEGALGAIANQEDRLADALRHHERAVELTRRDAPGSLAEGQSLHNLGTAAFHLGDYARAAEAFDAAREIQLRQLGELHPSVFNAEIGLAAIDEHRGALDAAAARLEDVTAVASRAGLAGQRASALTNLASVRRAQRRFDEALGHAEQAVTANAAHHGPQAEKTLRSRLNLAVLYVHVGKISEARGEFARLESVARASGQDVLRAAVLINVGDLELNLGDPVQAEHKVTEAIRVYSSVAGDEHPHVAEFRIVLALALLEQGRSREALQTAQQAVVVLRGAPGTHPALGRAELARAKALAARGRAGDAREAAEAALAAARAGQAGPALETKIREWLKGLDKRSGR